MWKVCPLAYQVSDRHRHSAQRSEFCDLLSSTRHSDVLASGDTVDDIAAVVSQLSNRYLSHTYNVSPVIHQINRVHPIFPTQNVLARAA